MFLTWHALSISLLAVTFKPVEVWLVGSAWQPVAWNNEAKVNLTTLKRMCKHLSFFISFQFVILGLLKMKQKF